MELEKEPNKIYKIYRDGKVKNWDYWARFLAYIIRTLKTVPEETGLFIVEQPNTNTSIDDYAKICFQKLKFDSLYIASQPVVLMTAAGVATGLCIHSGYKNSYVIPVCKAQLMPHALGVLPIGGSHVTRLLSDLIKKKYKLDLPQKIAERVKIDICYVSQGDLEEAEEEADAKPVFWVDDGVKILDDVGKERVIAPEVLFDPQLIEMDEWGIHEWAHASICKCDGQLVNDLWRNIVVSGGNTLIPGFSSRLLKELKALAPSDVEVKIINQKGVTAFLGAVKTINFESFEEFLIFRKEYKVKGLDALTNAASNRSY